MRSKARLVFFLFIFFFTELLNAANPIILVSIDGLRPDAIEKFKAKTLLKLKSEGTFYENARTVRPSLTLPSHTSMLTGLDPSQHGITWNDYEPWLGVVQYKTALEIAHEAGLHTAIFVAKDKLLHLNRPNAVDHFEKTNTEGEDIAKAFRKYVATNGLPDVSFLHLPDPDKVGHFLGWMSWFYGVGVNKADAALADIIKTATEAAGNIEPTFIVTADHGGHVFTHDENLDVNNKIPFIIKGQNIARGQVKPDEVRIYDAAASILALLHLAIPANWVGRPVPAVVY